jgi:steroid delta-isomerase-like uncharacterized protein
VSRPDGLRAQEPQKAGLVGELFAPTASLHTPDGVLSRLEGASYLLQAYATAFPDFNMAIHDMLSEGNQVVVRYTFAGTHLGPLADIPASKRAVSVPNGVLIFRLEASKVVEGFFMWDKYALLQQVGALGSSSLAG